MTKSSEHPIDQLRELSDEFRHVREEHRNKGRDSSVRRDQEDKLHELEERIEAILKHWIDDEPARQAWRDYAHSGGSVPVDDLEHKPPVFKGRAETGSYIEVRPADDGSYDALIDGSLTERLPARFDFGDRRVQSIQIASQNWQETTEASEAALAAVRNYTASPKGEPPWEWARALFSEGLIDADFSLTNRGRRMIGKS